MNQFDGNKAKRRILRKIIETYPDYPVCIIQEIFGACNVEKYLLNTHKIKST